MSRTGFSISRDRLLTGASLALAILDGDVTTGSEAEGY